MRRCPFCGERLDRDLRFRCRGCHARNLLLFARATLFAALCVLWILIRLFYNVQP